MFINAVYLEDAVMPKIHVPFEVSNLENTGGRIYGQKVEILI